MNSETLNTKLIAITNAFYPKTTTLSDITLANNNLNLNSYTIENLGSGSIVSGSTSSVNGGDIFTYVGSQSLPTTSSLATISANNASTTAITASNQLISNVLNPVSPQDACTLNSCQSLIGIETTRAEGVESDINTNLSTNYYTQTQSIANFCSRTSPTVSGNLNMNSHTITALGSCGTLTNSNSLATNATDVYNFVNSHIPNEI